jgi:hypothetical protein
MNPHIKQLLESAPFTTISTEGRLFSQRDVAVFAEALVRECGVALSPMLRDQISRGRAFDLIKQHFGVEL